MFEMLSMVMISHCTVLITDDAALKNGVSTKRSICIKVIVIPRTKTVVSNTKVFVSSAL